MTNPVIDNIRRSLGGQRSPLGPRPAIYESRQPESLDSEIEHFLDEVRKLSGVAQTLAPDSVSDALKALVTEQNIRKATVWNTPHLNQLQITNYLSSLGVELVSPNADKHEMALCDLGITEAEYLLPETGTIVLTSSAEKPRAVSLLPRIHLAIVRPEMLRPDLHQVFAEHIGRGEPSARPYAPDYLVFITGPSRTADIELTVTLGVHGPKSLHVWMLDS
jgi:L-lactate dehydrogenase complex protein LldG